MIKEEEIEYYRKNVTYIYVNPVARMIEMEEREYQKKEKEKELEIKPNYKRCKRCGEVKKIKYFYKNPLKSKGVFDYCKECAKKRAAELKMTKYKGKKCEK